VRSEGPADMHGASRPRRMRIAFIMGLVVCLSAVLWLVITPPTRVEVENQTAGILHDVVLTFPDHEVGVGDLEPGGRRQVAAKDISSIRYRCTRADGSRVDQVTGFTPDEIFRRIHVRITPTGSGTDYDLATAVTVDVLWYKVRRWMSRVFG
jgi:hypothetical protein